MAIQRGSPELDQILDPGQDLERLSTGHLTAEGPVWYREAGYLLYSDIRNNRRMKWTPGEGISVFHEPTNQANGLTRDLKGRLIACEGDSRRVTRTEPDGSITVVANRYKGLRLNRPNDVVVKSDGSIYFTDRGGGVPLEERQLDHLGVYRVTPDLGTLTLLVADFWAPNGLAFSPDETVMYIDDSRMGHVRAFNVTPLGTLEPQTGPVFFEFTSDLLGVPDGMKVDVEGNIYCAGPGGIWIIDSSGRHLGTVLTASPQATNCGWGGDDLTTLFITDMESLYRIQLSVQGVPLPVDNAQEKQVLT
jgi:gluconolactonase